MINIKSNNNNDKILLTSWTCHIFLQRNTHRWQQYFFANLAENNEVEEVLLKKEQKYMVTSLSINQKAEFYIIIPDLNMRHSFSNMIRSFEEERQKFNLACHFYKKDVFDITIPFKKNINHREHLFSYNHKQK